MIKAGAEGADEREVGTAEEKNTDEEGCRAAAGGHQDQGTKVAVKIQQVPEDEVRPNLREMCATFACETID